MILLAGAPISFVAPLPFFGAVHDTRGAGEDPKDRYFDDRRGSCSFRYRRCIRRRRKVRAALTDASLVPEFDPDEFENGVLVLIFKGSWDAVDQQALRSALQAKGLPGSFAIEATSSHGYV